MNYGKDDDDMFTDPKTGGPYRSSLEPEPYRYEPSDRVWELRGQLIGRMRQALVRSEAFLVAHPDEAAELLNLLKELRR